MNKLLPLMQREWLQHRFAWALMALLPLAIILLLCIFGSVQLDEDSVVTLGNGMPPLVAMISIVATMALLFLIAWVSSLIIVSNVARRDHADRSIEFWLSLPTSHSASVSAPMLVHMLLVPAAGLLVGAVGGYFVSLVMVTRISGSGALLSMPWLQVLGASMAVTARILGGLLLATLWLSPLVLLVALTTAYFRRWGWAILILGIGLGGALLKRVFGQSFLSDITGQWFLGAGRAFLATTGGFRFNETTDPVNALSTLPGWLASDFAAAVRNLGSPYLLGGLALAALCFVLLLRWRERGAGGAA